MLGGKTESLLCSPDFICPPSSGAASSSSVHALSNSLSSPTDLLVKEYLAETLQIWTVGLAVHFSTLVLL